MSKEFITVNDVRVDPAELVRQGWTAPAPKAKEFYSPRGTVSLRETGVHTGYYKFYFDDRLHNYECDAGYPVEYLRDYRDLINEVLEQ